MRTGNIFAGRGHSLGWGRSRIRKLTGADRAVRQAVEKQAISTAMDVPRHAVGNFYINDQPTGAVVGNDKAGSMLNPAHPRPLPVHELVVAGARGPTSLAGNPLPASRGPVQGMVTL